jgi:hypothetical protein
VARSTRNFDNALDAAVTRFEAGDFAAAANMLGVLYRRSSQGAEQEEIDEVFDQMLQYLTRNERNAFEVELAQARNRRASWLKIVGVVILALYALTIMVVAFADSWSTPWLALIFCPVIFAGIGVFCWPLPAVGGALLLVFGFFLGGLAGLIGAAYSSGVSAGEGIAVGLMLFSPLIASGFLFVLSHGEQRRVRRLRPHRAEQLDE